MSAIAKAARTERLRRPASHSAAIAVRARCAAVRELGLFEFGIYQNDQLESTMYLFENEYQMPVLLPARQPPWQAPSGSCFSRRCWC